MAPRRTISDFNALTPTGALGCGSRGNAGAPEMNDIVGLRIKRGKSFRLFACGLLREDVNGYFEQDIYSLFMIHVVTLKEERRERLPPITHVDGAGRLQIADRTSDPVAHKSAVNRWAGMGAVLDRSLNENEPVAEKPEQPSNCFLRTGVDPLCQGNLLLRKRPTASPAAGDGMKRTYGRPWQRPQQWSEVP